MKIKPPRRVRPIRRHRSVPARLEAVRKPPRRIERWAWPAGVGMAGLAWYVSDSLRHRREGAFGYALGSALDVDSPEFLRATEALTGAPISEGSEIELMVNGDTIFPAILETIQGARKTLTLETYVYWRGDITNRVAEAVCKRARAGVECKVILDALGSAFMDRAQIDQMRDAGVEVCLFRPIRPYTLRRLANRSHRRILVADGEVGMTGGVGIAEEWTGDAEDSDHWRDSHARVRGPVVRHPQGAFAEHWLEATGEALAGDDYLPHLEPRPDGMRMQLVRSESGVGDTNVETIYYLAIASAQRSLDLTAAYFVPRPAFTDALADAAERGVEVRILVPGPHIDKPFVRVAGRDSYGRLLAAGARIYEYQPTMLHAKALTVDGAWSSLGTVNFDNRSFQLHDEITLGVWDAGLAEQLTEQFERDLERSQEITPERWRDRGVRRRAAEVSMRVFRREL